MKEPVMKFKNLLYELKDRIGLITLNRPDKLNSLNQALWKEVRKALQEGDLNSEVEVHMITGSGRAFCAGDDISILPQVQDPMFGRDLFLDCIYGLIDTIVHLQKPLISAVNGYAYGGGCELVLLSDLAVASENATFALPEGRIAAWPTIFATFGPFLLGLKVANELTMLCEPISAERAMALRLVNKVVHPEDLMPTAVQMAQKLMKSSPISLRIIKETSSRILGERLYDFWISELRSLKEASRSEDCVEGISSFIEKRSPEFKGR